MGKYSSEENRLVNLMVRRSRMELKWLFIPTASCLWKIGDWVDFVLTRMIIWWGNEIGVYGFPSYRPVMDFFIVMAPTTRPQNFIIKSQIKTTTDCVIISRFRNVSLARFNLLSRLMSWLLRRRASSTNDTKRSNWQSIKRNFSYFPFFMVLAFLAGVVKLDDGI